MFRNTVLFCMLAMGNVRAVECRNESSRLVLDNGFVHLEFDEAAARLDVLKGDFQGQGKYGENLIGGIGMETLVTNTVQCRLLRKDASGASVQIDGVSSGGLGATWIIHLDAASRKFQLEVSSREAARLAIHCRQWFMVGFYERGVAQRATNGQRFAAAEPLDLFYTMDNTNGSVAIVPLDVPPATESVMVGDMLVQSWVQGGKARYDIYPNQYPFPAHRVPVTLNMEFEDLRTFYTAVYGSAAGCLGSFNRPGSAYPTLALPGRAYGDAYTFFDPDAWSTVATLSFSGDPYLEEQARRILELSESRMKTDGQIPHHFEGEEPTYVALSTAAQTGPNIFWLLASVEYVTATGDTRWLRGHYSKLQEAANWLLGFYDPERKLLKVTGSLWTDTFRRQGFTFDTNVMMLRLLPLLASVSSACDDTASAGRYTGFERSIRSGLEGLWNGDDHYVTSRSPDWQTVMDRVDSENYAAIAWKATTDPARVRALFQRLDRWAHPGGRGTWVSEGYYGVSDCFVGNTGDSACCMARHWWVDMVARHVAGDSETFLMLYRNIQTDLWASTWLTERYSSSGGSCRAVGYHEYPEVLNMLMREQIYGIDVKLDGIVINPIAKAPWTFSNGRLEVSYDPDGVRVMIPGNGMRTYRIHGLCPGAKYRVSIGEEATADAFGVVSVTAPVGRPLALGKVKDRLFEAAGRAAPESRRDEEG